MNSRPFEDTSSDLLPEESWKDVPGLEGYYQASCLGRVKSLDRIIPHPRLYQHFVKGRILRQSVALNKNIKSGVGGAINNFTLMLEVMPLYKTH